MEPVIGPVPMGVSADTFGEGNMTRQVYFLRVFALTTIPATASLSHFPEQRAAAKVEKS